MDNVSCLSLKDPREGGDGAGGGRGQLGNSCSQANVSSVLLQRHDGPCGLEKKRHFKQLNLKTGDLRN